MTKVGTDSNPLRVAIVGAGPSGFYVADHLFRHETLVAEVDMFDRLPTPHGLVRGGVAPDHQKIKSVTKMFDRTAASPHFRFYGNVEFGNHIGLSDLKRHYHQICFTTGAQTDRRLGIPGEDLARSYSATEFVRWYNGHPDCRDCEFDLSHERVAVIGVGNVAIDVARILCRTPLELADTDIADYALEALLDSQVKEVYLLGRRGPAQAAFTNPEIKELGELQGAGIMTIGEEVELDDLSRQALKTNPDQMSMRKVEILQSYASQELDGKPRKLVIRFFVSPVELIDNEAGQLAAVRLVRNELYSTEAGTLRSRPTDQFEVLPVGAVFRSVGYRGVPLPGVPFNDKWGVIWNKDGRVIDPDTQDPLIGEYTAGWIKRGPTGVIGTNKPDAAETVACMVEDVEHGRILDPLRPEVTAAEQLVCDRQPDYFAYADWLRLNQMEIARGQAAGRPRVKFTCVEDMLKALGRSSRV
jgi:ferredoxin--NADP+ reductase